MLVNEFVITVRNSDAQQNEKIENEVQNILFIVKYNKVGRGIILFQW